MTNDIILLIANALLYICVFIIYQNKKKSFDLGSVVLLFWVVISIVAIDLFNKPPGWAPYREMTIFPFIYFFLSFLIVSLPLLLHDYNNGTKIEMPSGKRMDIISYGLILLHLVCLLFLWAKGSLTPSALFDVENILENYANSSEIRTNFLMEIVSWVRFLVPIFFMYNYTEHKKLLSWGMAFCFLISFICALSTSSRLDMVRLVFSIPFVIFIFKDNLSKQQYRMISRMFLSIALALGGALFAVTLARFSNSRFDIGYYLEFYFAQCILYFNGYGLAAGGIRYGDKVFPILKRFLGLDWIKGTDINSRYWNLDFDDTLFVSFIGEYTIDFGVVAIMLFVVISIFIVYVCKKRNGKYAFIQILILSVPYQLLTIGFSVNPISERYLHIIFLIYLFLYIKFPLKNRKGKVVSLEKDRILS